MMKHEKGSKRLHLMELPFFVLSTLITECLSSQTAQWWVRESQGALRERDTNNLPLYSSSFLSLTLVDPSSCSWQESLESHFHFSSKWLLKRREGQWSFEFYCIVVSRVASLESKESSSLEGVSLHAKGILVSCWSSHMRNSWKEEWRMRLEWTFPWLDIHSYSFGRDVLFISCLKHLTMKSREDMTILLSHFPLPDMMQTEVMCLSCSCDIKIEWSKEMTHSFDVKRSISMSLLVLQNNVNLKKSWWTFETCN